jgi:hypothetical protein
MRKPEMKKGASLIVPDNEPSQALIAIGWVHDKRHFRAKAK